MGTGNGTAQRRARHACQSNGTGHSRARHGCGTGGGWRPWAKEMMLTVDGGSDGQCRCREDRRRREGRRSRGLGRSREEALLGSAVDLGGAGSTVEGVDAGAGNEAEASRPRETVAVDSAGAGSSRICGRGGRLKPWAVEEGRIQEDGDAGSGVGGRAGVWAGRRRGRRRGDDAGGEEGDGGARAVGTAAVRVGGSGVDLPMGGVGGVRRGCHGRPESSPEVGMAPVGREEGSVEWV